MTTDQLEQARLGDYTGMNFLLLIRMSNESRRRRRRRDRAKSKVPAYVTGLDIDSKDLQIKRCTADIEARGGKVVGVRLEPHTSAWKRRKVKDEDGNTIYRVIRPVYVQALKELKRGVSFEDGERVDALMCADPDRLTRDNRDLEDAIDAVNHAKRPIVELTHTMDLSTRYGQQMARQLVAMKNGQSADTAERVRLMHQAMQDEGIPTGGHRPFGWNEDKRTLHEVEAPKLRAALLEMLDRRPESAITREWNEQGLTTPQGGKFKPYTLTQIARNPRVCGYRMVHLPSDPSDPDSPKYAAVKLDADGRPVIGKWDALITPAQWTALLEIVGDKPVRNATANGSNTRKYECVGTLRCGKCDAWLRAMKAPPSAKKPAGFFYYTCPSTARGGCGGIKIPGPGVDAAVKELVVGKWEAEAAERTTTREPAEWDGQADLQRVYEDMEALKANRRTKDKARQISAERYYTELAELENEERDLVKARNAFTRRAHQDANRPVDLRADWDNGKLALADKRAYMVKALTAVIVSPADRRRTHQEGVEDRLTPVWVTTRQNP
jgi:DNA invertase Pin-like site-specific DNA recombinase